MNLTVAPFYCRHTQSSSLSALRLTINEWISLFHRKTIMTSVTIKDGKLSIQEEGWDKFWALRSRLEIPLEQIKGVYADPHVAESWRLG
jgi:hypothetical protein